MNSLVLPLAIPLVASLLCLILKTDLVKQRVISGLTLCINFVVATFLLKSASEQGYLTLRAGGWANDVGIVLVADVFSCMMLCVTSLVSITVLFFSFSDIESRIQSRSFFALFNFLILGVNGAFLTGDIFNLFVWFEIMLLTSFILLVIGRKPEQMEGAVKYVVLNLFSSFLFLVAVGILYAKVGSLNLADIARKVYLDSNSDLMTTTGVILLVSFGFKAAIFPFFFWLPASYHTPPTAISALFASLLTKVGVYALFRVFMLVFMPHTNFFQSILLVLACLTMVIGVLLAASQFEIKKILSVHIVSQIGYMILGLAIFTPIAIAGAIFYVVHNILVKTNLFLISGIVERKSGTTDLSKTGDLYKYAPFLSILFCLSAFSLAGIPPLSGFWAKLSLLKATVESDMYFSLFVALGVGVITLYSMTKIWSFAFWNKKPDESETKEISQKEAPFLYIPVIALTVASLLLGLYGNAIFELCIQSAEQLMDPWSYINAVEGS